jgi:aspartyl-tRNA(Asn)/glutamyl-tRNA(Gln) amidotransferase subunit A
MERMVAMASDAELCYLSIAQLGRAYRERELSPLEVTRAYLRRIEALDGRLHTYITVSADLALEMARGAEGRFHRDEQVGPLDGVPVALKDLFDTAGIRTTAQSELYADRIPQSDATVVRLLAAAGAPLLGKHTMHELALGLRDLDGFFPPARNPWNTERFPAGSSSGSGAAVAAGLCAGAMGSDTGGSIRGPASYCGIVGLKPSSGLVSRSGVVPLSWTLDHVGPMTRTVEDCAIMLGVLAVYDPRDPGSVPSPRGGFRSALERGPNGLRIGAPFSFVEATGDLDPETMAAYRQALSTFEQLGASVRLIELPLIDHAGTVSTVVRSAESFAFHEEDARERPEKFGAYFHQSLLEGALLTASDYLQALRGRTMIRQAMAELMESIDLIVLPTRPHPAHDFAAEMAAPRDPRISFTGLFNITGQPALSLPCGFSSERLPIGLQIVGRLYEDGTVLGAAQAYEQRAGWSGARPPLDDA